MKYLFVPVCDCHVQAVVAADLLVGPVAPLVIGGKEALTFRENDVTFGKYSRKFLFHNKDEMVIQYGVSSDVLLVSSSPCSFCFFN